VSAAPGRTPVEEEGDVGVPIGLVFDANDPERLGRFWRNALGYVEVPPADVAAEEAGYALIDPDGAGPTVYFQPVPEPKAAKNRLHLDLRVGGGANVTLAERAGRMEARAAELVRVGATLLRRHEDPGDWFIVMADPEGNEFCLV
jgi:hypothetical protein